MTASPDALVELEDLLGAELFSANNFAGAPVWLAERYQLLEVRGRGARGLVVKARDRSLGRFVAIKLYPNPEEALIAEVQGEATMLAQLRHKNIVAVFDFQRSALSLSARSIPCVYLVMDYVEGAHLRSWIASEEPTQEEILEVCLAAGEGLAAAHQQGVLHRDVKPANIVCDSSSAARMVDFGLARSVPTASESQAPRHTLYGYTKGTVAYMAPEARRGQADASSDQFSLAVSIWECLSGELPFDPNAGEWRLAHEDDFFGARLIPPAIAAVLRKALSYRSHERFDSVEHLLTALRATGERSHPGWVKAHARHLALASGVTALAALALALILTGSDEPDDPSDADASMSPDAELEGKPLKPAILPAEEVAKPESAREESPSPVSVVAPPTRPDADIAEATPSCDASPFAGRWRLNNRVLWADDTYWIGVEGFYWFDVEVDAQCEVTGTLTRIGDSGMRRYKNPQSSTRTMEVSRAADGSRWLHADFKLSGEESRKLHKLNVTVRGDELAGDLTFHQYSDRPTMTGVLRAARGDEVGAVPTDADTSPCPTQCRVLCVGPSALARCLQTLCADRSSLGAEGCGAPDPDAPTPMGAQDLLSAVYGGTAVEEAGDKCREHGRRLGAYAQWVAWRADERYDIDLSVSECDVSATMRPSDGSDSYTATGRINAKGQWFLRAPASIGEPVWGMTGRNPAIGAAGDYPRLPLVAYPRG